MRKRNEPSRGGRIGLTLFGLFFGTIGLVVMLAAARGLVREREVRRWTPTPAEIVEASVGERGERYEFQVRFRYEAAGRELEGDRYSATQRTRRFEDVATRRRLLDTYGPGTTTTVYVNPHDPAEAVLTRGRSAAGELAGVAFSSIFVLIGYGMVIGAWVRRPARAVTSRSAVTGGQHGRTIVIAFCMVFIVIGLVVTFFTFVRPHQRQQAARNWEAVEAVVERSRVRTHRGDDSTTYSVYIAYRYRYDGREYEGDRHRFLSGSSSGRAAKQAVVNRHPPGSRLTVYVDPAAPHESVIERDAGARLYLGLLPLLFSLFGGVFLAAFLRSQGTAGGMTAAGAFGRGAADAAGRTRRPQPFRPESSPRTVFLVLLVAALFWNGIVAVFVTQTLGEWRRGRRPVVSTLFLLPFVAVGLGLVGGAVYNFLRLFNPRPRIDPPSRPLTPGSTHPLRFRMSGNATKLRSLSIAVVGREEATYRRGTDSVTDRHEFHREVLFESEDARTLTQGAFELRIPPGAMPSFRSPNNKIVWTLSVRGRIPRWPDVSEDFVLDVLPGESLS